MSPAPSSPRSPRWRRLLRFSLGTLTGLMVVAAVLFAVYGPKVRAQLDDRAFVVPTAFDIETGRNVRWTMPVGSQSFGGPVIADGKVFVGTNNGAGYLRRYPSTVDLGVVLCFRARDGKFLWQASREKLKTGRVHDWPLQGITSTPRVEGDRLWCMTNRCEVLCLDTEGFHDQEDDGLPDGPFDERLREADTVWRLDLMSELGVNPHNGSCSTPAIYENVLFLVTGNAVGASHVQLPTAEAPSFLALDKRTGKVLWSDASPGKNVLHGQWGSPTVARLGGVVQVLFPGGDGWLYSFAPEGNPDGTARLLWKFDCNPKDSEWILGGRGTRNNLVCAPAVAAGKVYVAVGQDPEHGEGRGRVWCIDATKRGDVSPEQVFHKSDPTKPLPHRRLLACDKERGEFTRPNPNSAALWEYTGSDLDGDGELAFEETMHRSISHVMLKNGLAIVTDYGGLVHCLDAKTGKAHWINDRLSQIWTSPLISADHVYVTDEDGEVAVFKLSADPAVAMPGGNPISISSLGNSIYGTPVSADNTLYLLDRKNLMAIAAPSK